jgi:hypothetical protein
MDSYNNLRPSAIHRRAPRQRRTRFCFGYSETMLPFAIVPPDVIRLPLTVRQRGVRLVSRCVLCTTHVPKQVDSTSFPQIGVVHGGTYGFVFV